MDSYLCRGRRHGSTPRSMGAPQASIHGRIFVPLARSMSISHLLSDEAQRVWTGLALVYSHRALSSDLLRHLHGLRHRCLVDGLVGWGSECGGSNPSPKPSPFWCARRPPNSQILHNKHQAPSPHLSDVLALSLLVDILVVPPPVAVRRDLRRRDKETHKNRGACV